MKRRVNLLALTLMLTAGLAACSPGGAGGSGNSGTSAGADSSAVSDASAEADASADTDASVDANASAGKDASQAFQNPETVTITSLDGNRQETDLEVPFDPQCIAVLDMASLDILDNLGLGDRIVGSASTSLDYLQAYVTDESVANLGTIKEADLEAVMASEPDIIFIGGRLSSSYDALSEIAPVVYLATDTDLGAAASVAKNASAIASIFGLEEQVDSLMAEFDARIQTLADFAEGKTAVVGMCTSGGFNVLGNDGRCSLIGVEVGFENLANSDVTSTHGNESSFELLVSLDPDYIFVMDRDSAIGTEGAQLAKDIMENELVMGTRAYQDGNLIYLEHPAVWYTAEGGITALDVMLADLETALLK